jgi:hypothetical protein
MIGTRDFFATGGAGSLSRPALQHLTQEVFMFVARWQIDARFGHKQTVVDLLRKWEREIGAKAGTDRMDFKILTGSIGAREATIEANHTVDTIAQLEQFFAVIGKSDAHGQWGKDMEPHVVSGSAVWNIYRML